MEFLLFLTHKGKEVIMRKNTNKNRQSYRHPHWDYRNNAAYFVTICTNEMEHYFGSCKNGKMKLSSVGAIIQGFWYDIPKHFPFVILGEYITMPNHIHGIIIINHKKIPVGTLHCNVQNDGNRNIQNDGNRNTQNDNTQNSGNQNNRNHPNIFFPRKIHNVSEQNQQNTPIDPMAEFNDYINAQRGDAALSKHKLQDPILYQRTLQCNVPTGNVGDKNDFFRDISPKYGSLGSVIRSFKSVCSRYIRRDFSDMEFKWQNRFHDHIIRNEDALFGIANYIQMNPENWNKKENVF